MADFYTTFSGNSDYRLHLRVLAGSQSSSSNYTNLSGTLWVEKTSGSGYLTYNTGNSGSVTGSIFFGVVKWAPYDFSSYSSKQIGSGANSVTHDSNGNKTATGNYSASDSAGGNFGSASGSYSLGLTRIPEEPGKPGTPTVSSITPDSATVSWSAADRGHANISDYFLQVSQSSSFSSTVFSAAVGTSLSKALTGLPKNDSLYTRVAAINSDGTGPWSSTRTFVTPPGVPSTPSGISAAFVSDTLVSVGWNHTSPSDSAATSSQVRKSVNGGAWTELPPVSVTTALTIDATANTKRIVQVREINSTGASGWSASSPAVYTTPAAPTSVAAVKNASLNIVLSFTSNVAYVEYQHVVEHGTVTGGVTTWDGSPLTTLSAGVASYTHVSPDAGSLHVYRVYASNTGVGNRASTKTTSNTVQLLVAPNKPTLLDNPQFVDKTSALVTKWVHNSVDTTPQKYYEASYSTDGGSNWTSTGKVTSTVAEDTKAASSYPANTALTVRVRTWGEAATGGSDGTGASVWSDQSTVTFKTRPVASVAAPANGSTYTKSALTVGLGFAQAEGATFVTGDIQVLRGAALLETRTTSTRAATLMETSVENGETYTVVATVTDSNGLTSTEASSTFDVAYTLPVPAVVTATYLDDSGMGQLDISIADPGAGQVAVSSVTITRTIDGVTEAIVLEYPKESELTILDTTPTIHGTNVYRITTISDIGAENTVQVTLVTSECRRAFLSKGAGFYAVGVFGANLEVSEGLSVAGKTVEAAGRIKPIGLYGLETSVSLSVSSFVFKPFGSTIDELRTLLLVPGRSCYRDSSGRRVFGISNGSVSYKRSDRGTLSFTLTETS